MPYEYFTIPHEENISRTLRTKLFERMQREGLLPFAMHAYANPTLEDWLDLTHPQKGCLISAVPKGKERLCENMCAMALLTPRQGRLWAFDFTVFREHFSKAIPLSRGALPWIFANLPCDALMGLSAKSNVHAWRLAQKAGFTVLGRVPGACYMAKKFCYEEGVLVLATKADQKFLNDA